MHKTRQGYTHSRVQTEWANVRGRCPEMFFKINSNISVSRNIIFRTVLLYSIAPHYFFHTPDTQRIERSVHPPPLHYTTLTFSQYTHPPLHIGRTRRVYFCMYLCIIAYVRTYIHYYTEVHTNILAFEQMQELMFIRTYCVTYIRTYASTYIHIYIIYIYMYICVCHKLCTYVRACPSMYRRQRKPLRVQ